MFPLCFLGVDTCYSSNGWGCLGDIDVDRVEGEGILIIHSKPY